MTIKEMRSTIDALAAAYQDTRDNGGNPDTAARGFIQAVGAEEAAQCMAAMIRRAAWDGRISREAKAWAQGVKLSCEWERHIEDTYCDAIHPAHLSQIAETMPKELEHYAAEAGTEERSGITVQAIRERVEEKKPRSAWDRGVLQYAEELLDNLEEAIDGGYFHQDDLEAPKVLERAMLNGADDWNQYSWGGCSLIYNADIAERLCTRSELKRKRGGYLRPNSNEEWLDTQARALFQASRRILWAAWVLRHERLEKEEA